MDEHMVLSSGETLKLRGDLIHEIPKSLSEWTRKHDWYAERECKDILGLYVSMTYNGGRTWITTDTTPHNPVQRGCVDLQGTSNKTATDQNICNQRNLLDFNDITVDSLGRVLVAFADGCTGPCATHPRRTSHGATGTVMRLTRGRGLYRAFDARLAGRRTS